MANRGKRTATFLFYLFFIHSFRIQIYKQTRHIYKSTSKIELLPRVEPVFLNGGGTSEDDGGNWKQYCGKGGVEVPLGGICFKASLHQRFTTIRVYTLNYLQKTVVCNIKTCQFTPLRLHETVDGNSSSL